MPSFAPVRALVLATFASIAACTLDFDPTKLAAGPDDAGSTGTMTCTTPADCHVPNATSGCSGGVCTLVSCNSGYVDCDHLLDDGCEAHPGDEVENCGACGNVCATPEHTRPVCMRGACGIACTQSGFADCDGDLANGCETNQRDPATCGSDCGRHVCASPLGNCGVDNQGNVACRAGCAAGETNCVGASAGSSCADLQTDPANCGACGTRCPMGASCVAGTCACPTDTQACGDQCVDLQTDVQHCGTCATRCTAPRLMCCGGGCRAICT